MPPVVIGNDIISLSSLPIYDENRRHRYARKIMVDSEYEAWQESGASEIYLFKYWALKEAAYKIWNREARERVFNPKWFVVGDFGGGQEIVVQGPVEEFLGVVKVNDDYIYALLLESNYHEMESKSLIYDITITDGPLKKINKRHGLPFIKINNKLVPVSVSHCGNWCALEIPQLIDSKNGESEVIVWKER